MNRQTPFGPHEITAPRDAMRRRGLSAAPPAHVSAPTPAPAAAAPAWKANYAPHVMAPGPKPATGAFFAVGNPEAINAGVNGAVYNPANRFTNWVTKGNDPDGAGTWVPKAPAAPQPPAHAVGPAPVQSVFSPPQQSYQQPQQSYQPQPAYYPAPAASAPAYAAPAAKPGMSTMDWLLIILAGGAVVWYFSRPKKER